MNLSASAGDISNVFDRLLNTLGVSLHECTACEIPAGYRARFEPIEMVTVYYIVSGEGSLQMGNSPPAKFGPQSVIVAPARTHQSWSHGEATEDEMLWQDRFAPVDSRLVDRMIGAEPDQLIRMVRSRISVTSGGVPGFFAHLREPIVDRLLKGDATRLSIESMIAEIGKPGWGSQAMAECYMRMFLILLMRKHLQFDKGSSSSFAMMRDPRLAKALIHVLEQPGHAHSLDSLAAAAGMSRTTFNEHFRKVFGQSPIEFLQEFRLQFAAHLLVTTQLPVNSIAASVGYASRSYFSRAFRAAYEMDPSAYRDAHGTDA